MFSSRLLIFITLLVCAQGLPAKAYFYDGNDLNDECKEKSMKCLGLLTGIADALADDAGYVKPEFQICTPRGARPDMLLDVVLNELQQHPERRTQPAIDIVVRALHQAFPCK